MVEQDSVYIVEGVPVRKITPWTEIRGFNLGIFLDTRPARDGEAIKIEDVEEFVVKMVVDSVLGRNIRLHPDTKPPILPEWVNQGLLDRDNQIRLVTRITQHLTDNALILS